MTSRDRQRRFAVLRAAPCLFALPPTALRTLARKASSLTASAGDVILRQGQRSNRLFVVERGRFEVVHEPAARVRLPIATLEAGDFFGATSVHTGGPATATVVAQEPGVVLALNRGDVKAALAEEPACLADFEQLAGQRADTLRALVSHARSAPAAKRGRIIAVYSPKGGSGKTTIALNLAGVLAEKESDSVVVVDLALPFNHVALQLDLRPTGSLARLAECASADFEARLMAAALHHRTGLWVLPGAVRPEEADLISAELVGRGLNVLQAEFKDVVVDLSSLLLEPILAVLERADQLVLVAPPELAALKDLRALQSILLEVLHVPASSINVVVSYRAPRTVLGVPDVERTLGRPVVVEFEYDGSRAEEATLHGELPALVAPRCAIARSARLLAERLTHDERRETVHEQGQSHGQELLAVTGPHIR